MKINPHIGDWFIRAACFEAQWESSDQLRFVRGNFAESWWLCFRCGVRHSPPPSVPGLTPEECDSWINPFAYIRLLGMTIGVGVMVYRLRRRDYAGRVIGGAA